MERTESNYTSCIKIGGIPILPPLITPSKLRQIQEYKRKAIEVEIKLKNKRELHSKVINKTLENSLAFSDDALNISDIKECDHLPNTTVVPLSEKFKKASTLTFSIFDVTEYNDNGVVLLNDYKHDTSSVLSASKVELNLTHVGEESLNNAPPRILRSNSYTLEFPSPILLEHFKKQHNTEVQKYSELNRRSSDVGISSHSTICDDSAYKTCESEDYQSRTSTDYDSIESVVKVDTYNDCDISKVVEDCDLVLDLENKKDEEASLQEILATMPENEVKDILDMLERHRNETQLEILDNEEELPINNDNFSEPSNFLSTSTPMLIDLDSDDTSFYCNSSRHEDTDIGETLTSSKELLLNNPDKTKQNLKVQWAGTILTAAAKGYLTRRLKRTVRVQDLIQTIREALVCAMSLHTEKTDFIQPSDVELHRRLIQQISSACYEFYDIFFALSKKEQMAIIALDRQRLQEKSKRPKSTSSLKLHSRRSTVKSPKNCFSTKQKKNLVPSFAA